jgi:hypothetical protein
MKCPFCAKEMATMVGTHGVSSYIDASSRQETLYYCEKHGVMNKSTDLKEKVDQIVGKA